MCFALPFAYAQVTARVKAVYLSVAWGSASVRVVRGLIPGGGAGQPFREIPCFSVVLKGWGGGVSRCFASFAVLK